MATTAKSKATKTKSKSTSSKVASRPASTKTKSAASAKTARKPAAQSAPKSDCRSCEIFFGIMMIVLSVAILVEVAINVCMWIWG